MLRRCLHIGTWWKKPLNAHPLFSAFVRAAHENRMRNETSMDKNVETEPLIPERASVVSAD